MWPGSVTGTVTWTARVRVTVTPGARDSHLNPSPPAESAEARGAAVPPDAVTGGRSNSQAAPTLEPSRPGPT